LYLRPFRFQPAQHGVGPDEMADVEAHELDFVVREHFADPLHPFYVLLSGDLAIDIGIGRCSLVCHCRKSVDIRA
jgi:hypothetical protein